MRIAVCLKQVPAASDGATDMERGFVVRTGQKCVNPYDPPALEAALRLREAHGGVVEVFSMGPPSAREVLADALAMGADAAWLLTDPAFAGADSLATARTLWEAFKAAGDYDLYICGQKTTDGDTGQVGAALAALSGRPFVGRVESFHGFDAKGLKMSHRVDGLSQLVLAGLPAVLSVSRECFVARMPSLRLKMKKKPVGQMGLDDLGNPDPELYGNAGSPTRIKRVYHPVRPVRGEVARVDGRTAADLILEAWRGAHE